jgi:hypothetical protein
MLQPETLRELKALTIDESQRSPSVPNHPRQELVNVLTIFWAAGPRLFDCDKLAKVLEERPSADRLRFDLITAIVPEANPQMIFSVFLNFLSQQGETQDSVLKGCALVTNVDTGELENVREAKHIRKRADQLARCFIENRSNIIDALVNAIRIWVAGQHKTEIPAAASPSGSVGISVSGPMANAESKTASEKKNPRSETSLEQLKTRAEWLDTERKRRGWTANRLATLTGVKNTTIKKILVGENVYSSTLDKLRSAEIAGEYPLKDLP